MPALLYGFALTLVFTTGITMMIQPHRQTRAFHADPGGYPGRGNRLYRFKLQRPARRGNRRRLAGFGHLDNGFDDQGVGFTWRLADHPVVSVNAGGDATYLAFLGGRTPGGFETDGSYTFIPVHDVTYYRAANNWYNLFAYAGNDFSCNTP